jgi:hypothetical protein
MLHLWGRVDTSLEGVEAPTLKKSTMRKSSSLAKTKAKWKIIEKKGFWFFKN